MLGNTPITFPIEWNNSKIPGYAIRGSMPNFHGLSAFIVMSSVAARFFTPQVSGIGAAPGGSTVFRIDHDEIFNQTTHLQYQPWKNGPWVGFNWRYDSGLVAGPVPCAGGNCANGPNGTDTHRGRFRHHARSAIPGGTLLRQRLRDAHHCRSARPGFARHRSTDPSTSRFPPPARRTTTTIRRASPRAICSIWRSETTTSSTARTKSGALRLSVVNLANKEALYNFLSTFSGTHYVTPRALTATIGFHF